MSFTLSPNMTLPIPGVGTAPSPTWATNLNSALQIIDQHNHTAGSGVLITPAALNINSTLSLANNFATNIAGLTLTPQLSTPANNTVYESGVDLYYVDGLGNNIPITANGGIAGAPGSISNLTSPASASYVSASKTFVWQSAASIAANLDAGSVLLRNLSPNSTNAITLQAPAALSSSYNVVLPTLPGSTSLLTIDTAGNMSAPYSISGGIAALILPGSLIGTQLAAATLTGTEMASNINLPGNAVQENGRNVVVANTNDTASLCIVRGQITNIGTVSFGSGFTVSLTNSPATNTYHITFTTPFSDSPSVTGSVVTTSANVTFIVNSISASGFTAQCCNASSNPSAVTFNFIAIGQR